MKKLSSNYKEPSKFWGIRLLSNYDSRSSRSSLLFSSIDWDEDHDKWEDVESGDDSDSDEENFKKNKRVKVGNPKSAMKAKKKISRVSAYHDESDDDDVGSDIIKSFRSGVGRHLYH